MKKNNKGFTLIEVVISFSLIMIVMVYLLRTIVIMNDAEVDLLKNQEFSVYETNLLKDIYNDINSNNNNITLLDEDNRIIFKSNNFISDKTITFDYTNNSITYDDTIYELPDNFKLKKDSYTIKKIEDDYIIKINLLDEKEDRIIKIIVQN